MIGDVEDDRSGFEQDEIALFIGRDLAERMAGEVRWLLHCGKGQQADLVGLPHLLERPAYPRVAGKALSPIGRAFEGGDGDRHGEVSAPLPARQAGRRRMSTIEVKLITGTPS